MEWHFVVVVVVEVVADKPIIVVLVTGMVWILQHRLGHMKLVAYPYNPLRYHFYHLLSYSRNLQNTFSMH